MSDALLGVIVGGVITSVIPLVTLYFGHIRWKRETKLEYLKSERQRLQILFKEALNKVAVAQAQGKGNYFPADMLSEMVMLMPKKVSETFSEVARLGAEARWPPPHAYLVISLTMQAELADIDKQIREMVS